MITVSLLRIMHDKNGLPQIIEINPRQSGSIFNSLKSERVYSS